MLQWSVGSAATHVLVLYIAWQHSSHWLVFWFVYCLLVSSLSLVAHYIVVQQSLRYLFHSGCILFSGSATTCMLLLVLVFIAPWPSRQRYASHSVSALLFHKHLSLYSSCFTDSWLSSFFCERGFILPIVPDKNLFSRLRYLWPISLLATDILVLGRLFINVG